MKDIIIVGAAGFGREVLQWIKDVNKVTPTWNIKGFLDDNLEALDGFECDYPVIGTIKDWSPSGNEVFALALAGPKVKESVVSVLKAKDAKFATVIHPTSIVGEYCRLGEGVIITPRCKLSPNIVVDEFVTILGCGVGHDAHIGAYSTLCGYCAVCGHVQIGKRAFIGTSAVVAPSKKVGDDAYVCMGSMVMTNVKPGIKVMGNPAKKFDL
ncbi:NeuD/PglB/VioB family sugar acetyltransferase [Bacteroides thetaiotaomicron]|jgi:sugar O-acyltransferase, sialic acid O-acetyltransferase neuD family|uniref:NeuD/PglB/VioB family sugar acetyltransferase n=1 Tax=Bacteroides thetaiotaomicron TaxID=818 RepID=UPI0039B4DC98|nr:NeuD/PglB/VioB family sugar acetyltransferase [Bacteroides thetaiotaomicron]